MSKLLSLFLIIVALTVGTGCHHSRTAQSPYRLAVAKRLYEQRQYHQAQDTLSNFILESGSDRTTLCEAYYLRGLCFRHQGASYDTKAKQDFTKAITRSCHPMIKGLAHVGLGHIHFEQGLASLTKAKYHYLTALNQLDDAAPKDAVLYRVGVTLQRLGYWSQADRYFLRCVHHFPSSKFAGQAKRRVGAKIFRLQIGAFSDLKRAQQNVKSLSGTGFQFDSTLETHDRKTLYYVRTGRYTTYQMALSQLDKLSRRDSGGIIVACK